MPVGIVENSFFPCQATPTKIVHLDNHHDLASTRDKAGSKELWPKKIWPTCRSPDIKHNTNQLELVSELDKVSSLVTNDLLVIAVVRNEMIMLPAFLSHYRGLGVRSFVIVDNCSGDGTREYLYGQPDVILYSADTEYRYSHYGVAWQQAVLGNLCLNKWALLVDADELLVYEGCETKPIHEFIAEVEAEGANAVRTDMIDMYPYGDLAEADFTRASPFDAAPWFDNPPLITWKLGSGMYSNGPSLLSGLRHRLAAPAAPNAFTSQKYGLIRYQPWVRYSQGLHDVSNVKVSNKQAWFAHFKYHAGFKEKVETEIRRGQHYNNAEEYRRYAAMLAEGQGGFGKSGLSCRYGDSTDFRKQTKT